MTKNEWYNEVEAAEVLEAIADDDGSCDSWGYACDWLSGRHGVDLDESYTIESIKDAVENDDPDLLEQCQ